MECNRVSPLLVLALNLGTRFFLKGVGCNTSGVTSSLSTKIMARERDIINIASYVDGHAILNFGESLSYCFSIALVYPDFWIKPRLY